MLVVGILLPSPAAAHTGTVTLSSNERSRILSDKHPLPGVEVRLHPLAKQVTLVNHSDTTLIVLGYTGEPFLRVGPDGVYQNQSSPSCTAANANPLHPDAPELRQAPVWKRITTASTAQWHDHRVHWVTKPLPEAVQKAPDQQHILIERWSIPLAVAPLVEGTSEQVSESTTEQTSDSAKVQSPPRTNVVFTPVASIQGDAQWIPNDNPLPYAGISVVLAILGYVLSRTRVGSWICVATLGIAGIVSGIGLRGDALTPLLSAGLGGAAIVAVALRQRYYQVGSFLLLACASVLTFVAGIGILEVLRQPVLVTTWPITLMRLTVVAALGLGPAIVAAVARDLQLSVRASRS